MCTVNDPLVDWGGILKLRMLEVTFLNGYWQNHLAIYMLESVQVFSHVSQVKIANVFYMLEATSFNVFFMLYNCARQYIKVSMRNQIRKKENGENMTIWSCHINSFPNGAAAKTNPPQWQVIPIRHPLFRHSKHNGRHHPKICHLMPLNMITKMPSAWVGNHIISQVTNVTVTEKIPDSKA